MFDAIVIGGSFAGMSAALQLARARRKVAVIDAGVRRNRFAHAAYGFLGHDGRAPGDIAADAKAQLLAYPNVSWFDAKAERADGKEDDFSVSLSTGEALVGRRMILATGVTDTLPDIEGLTERWGDSVFHCPYCHGYELNGGPVGVLAVAEASLHQALMLPDWGPTTFFLNGVFEPDAEQMESLAQRGVALEREKVVRISGAGATVELGDGRAIELAGLAVMPHTELASPIAVQIGCEMEDGHAGSFIKVLAAQETSIAGVFACGDAARAAGSVALAAGDGVMAGMGTHRSLMGL